MEDRWEDEGSRGQEEEEATVLEAVDGLAIFYRNWERLNKAEKMCKQVLESRRNFVEKPIHQHLAQLIIWETSIRAKGS